MKSIRKYQHINAGTVDEACSLLKKYGEKAWVIAGGTDMLGTMRFEVLHDYPGVLINLKTIPGLDYIKEEDGVLKIGALTRLEDIAESPQVKSKYTALSEAARRTASPHVRAMGTIGGNLCQLIRCWYFRKEDNRFDCIRKGGKMCHATCGENRYHSIFGAARVGTPPCSAGCPSGADIPSYLEKVREGKLDEAAEILLSTNPLPSITGRVCPHYCEQECNRGEFDESLSIRSIERYIGDYILEHVDEIYRALAAEKGKKIAVVGAGPAGLSAAYYLRKLGYSVTVFEELEEAGGVLTYGIPPYRLPEEIVRKQVKALEKSGIEFKYNTRIGREIKLKDLDREYDAVFCATGAWQQPALKLEHEELLVGGLKFLGKVNRGLKKVEAKKVLVIGGGSVAVDVATSALRLGAVQVTMACLESREEMPALGDEVEQAIKEGIKVMPSWGPSRILVENGKIAGMELVKCSRVYDSEHRFAPQYDQTVKEKVEADMVILAIGQRPDLSWAEGELEIKRGMIAVDPQTQAASKPKVYAGGDAAMVSGPASVTAAVAAGRRAAESINRMLGGSISTKSKQVEHLSRAEYNELIKQSRVKLAETPVEQLKIDSEDVPGLSLKAVESEATRCFNCGCDGVNPSDLAAALVALDARIVTSRRTIKAEDFWAGDRGLKPTVLEEDEIMTGVEVPGLKEGVKTSFIKFALRKSIDFPIVNCAAAVESEGGVVTSARICLNAVYCNPYRVKLAEEAIKGKVIDEASAESAGEAAISNAIALPYNRYKVQIAKTMVKRAILGCR